MMYNQTLNSPNDIEVMTYYKSSSQVMMSGPSLQNVIVESVGESTCSAKIGESDETRTYSKQSLFEYINFCCFSCGN